MKLKEGQLSRIEIKGYKSIKDAKIDFGKINVLIGSNGAGKSNFISAFSLLQNVLDKNLRIFANKRGVNSLLYNGRKVTDRISFDVSFGQTTYGFNLIPTNDNGIFLQEERFSCGEDVRTWISAGGNESMWDQIFDEKNERTTYDFFKKQIWKVYHFQDSSDTAKLKQECNLSDNVALQTDAGNLAAMLYRLRFSDRKRYQEIVETVRLVAPYFEDFVLEPQALNKEQIVLRWQQKGCEDIFNASQLSDGTLRFICLTTLLLQPHELQPATIIVDEPELGLHPYAITVFAEMVKQLSDEKQIIISTQSVELLNEFDVEDVLVVDKGEQGTIFKRLDEDELRVWLEEDYALGELWKKNLLGGRLSL